MRLGYVPSTAIVRWKADQVLESEADESKVEGADGHEKNFRERVDHLG